MKLPLSNIYQSVNMLFGIKRLGLGMKVDYWCTKNIKALADDYNFCAEKLDVLFKTYCDKGEDGQYCKYEDNKTIFNLKNDIDEEKFKDEFNELMTMECEEFEPFILNQEVFDKLPNVDSDKFNVDVLNFLLPL